MAVKSLNLSRFRMKQDLKVNGSIKSCYRRTQLRSGQQSGISHGWVVSIITGTCVPSLAYPHFVLLGFDSPRKTWTAERPVPVRIRRRIARVTSRNTTKTAILQKVETPTSTHTRRRQIDSEASFTASSATS